MAIDTAANHGQLPDLMTAARRVSSIVLSSIVVSFPGRTEGGVGKR